MDSSTYWAESSVEPGQGICQALLDQLGPDHASLRGEALEAIRVRHRVDQATGSELIVVERLSRPGEGGEAEDRIQRSRRPALELGLQRPDHARPRGVRRDRRHDRHERFEHRILL